MQNCNLERSLQFLQFFTHLTSVKCDCNGFAVVAVVNCFLVRDKLKNVTLVHKEWANEHPYMPHPHFAIYPDKQPQVALQEKIPLYCNIFIGLNKRCNVF